MVVSVTLPRAVGGRGPQGPQGPEGPPAQITENAIVGALGFTPADAAGVAAKDGSNVEADAFRGAIGLGFIVTAGSFGAKGDGVADNADAFADLIVAAETGLPIHFPAGIYKTSKPLLFTKPVHLTADPNTRITLTAAADYVVRIDLTEAGGGFDHVVSLKNLILDGQGLASDGLSLKGVINGRFDEIRATNVTVAGLHLHWAQLCLFNNFECSNNIEAFTTTPVHGILADEASSSANTFVNPTIEHVSGSGVLGIALMNSTFVNGTSEGNNVGLEFGAPVGPLTAIGNTVIGMDLEVNPGGDIILHPTAYANDFNGLKAGFVSGPVLIKAGSSRNLFKGGVTGGFVFEAGSTRNVVEDVSLIGAVATIVDNGVKNEVRRAYNLSTNDELPDTILISGSRRETVVSSGGTFVMNAAKADYEQVVTPGPQLIVAAPLNPKDGQAVDITIVNTGTAPLEVLWPASFVLNHWVNPPGGGRSALRVRYDANFQQWYSIETAGDTRKEITPGATANIDASKVDYLEVVATGATLTIANPTNPGDGKAIDLAILNPTGDPIEVIWGSAFRVDGWVDPPSGMRCSVRLRYNANFGRWYPIGAPSQVGVLT